MQSRILVGLLLLLTGLAYVTRHHLIAAPPGAPDDIYFWHWSDQSRYLRSAQAWAAGNLDPARHWYLPGYPLLGAAFIWLTPRQPFYVPDLICLVAACWLFVELARSLAPGRAWAAIIGALVFTATVTLSPFGLKSFVEPWTTTPCVPLIYASLLLALRVQNRASAWRAGLLGACTASIALFRPTEAGIMLTVLGSFSAVAVLRQRIAWRDRIGIAASGMAGVAAPLLVLAGLHLAIYGPHAGFYVQQSGNVGFEWRLIPLRWVTLFVGAQPLFADARSMVQVFAWILPGIAGMVACLVATRGAARARHMLVVVAATVHCLVYLAYRDLHPQGLFHFGNYQYFKWLLPVFGLYAAYLLDMAGGMARARVACGVGALAAAALFCWRPQWSEPAPGYVADDARIDGRTLVLSHGLQALRDGVRVAASGNFEPIFLSSYIMTAGDRIYASNADFKACPVPGGFIFTVLRPMPAVRMTVNFPLSVVLDGRVKPRFGRQAVVFGCPAWALRIGVRLKAWWRRHT